MSQDPPNHNGHVLADRYEIIDEIGRGGFGMVYRARQLNMNREVAVKVLPPQFMAITDVVERFKREAQLASRLQHPNTITIHDYGQADDLLFIVMELLNGEDLADVLKREHHLPEQRLMHIARQTLQSLAEAHEHGIVHRDLKPENIFLTRVGGDHDFVKVLDFGIAKLAQPPEDMPEGRRLTVTGSTVGTPVYMSPEQAAGEDVDHLTDLYAMGVILYEMACGEPPFAHENPVKVMRAHLFEEVAPFPEQTGLSGSTLERVVMRALKKDQLLRFQSAGEFLRALDNSEPQLTALPRDMMMPPPRLDAPPPPSLAHESTAPETDDELISGLPTLQLEDAPSEDSFDDIAIFGDTAAFDRVPRQRETGDHAVAPMTAPAPQTPESDDAIPFGALGPSASSREPVRASTSAEISGISELRGQREANLPMMSSTELSHDLNLPRDRAPQAEGFSSTSSIITIVEPPPADEEVFVLTQPKDNHAPTMDVGRGGQAPLTMNPRATPDVPARATPGSRDALKAGLEPGRPPAPSSPDASASTSGEGEWSWDPTQSADQLRDVESGAFPQLQQKQQNLQKSRSEGDDPRRGAGAMLWVLLVLATLAGVAAAILAGLGLI